MTDRSVINTNQFFIFVNSLIIQEKSCNSLLPAGCVDTFYVRGSTFNVALNKTDQTDETDEMDEIDEIDPSTQWTQRLNDPIDPIDPTTR